MPTPTWTLGLNAYHGDAAACLLRDGELVAAAEEERFRRVKHWAGLPTQAIRWCLSEGGIGLGDVAHLAVNQDARKNLLHKLAYLVRSRPDLSLVVDRLRNKKERADLAQTISAELNQSFAGRTHFVEHHHAHLASAFLVSPFEEAVAVSIDGFGDFASAAWGIGRGSTVEVEDRVYFPHSLGIFYQAITQFLGFHAYGDEYKVMGLAPYGKPSRLDAMRRVVRLAGSGHFTLDLSFFRHASEKIDYVWTGGEPVVGRLYSARLEELLGPPRHPQDDLTSAHRDIAASAQAMYEEAFFHVLEAVHARYNLDALAISGGCAMNSVANGKVRGRTPFKRLYVQASPGDAGGAIGAALIASGTRERWPMRHAYWGPRFGDAEIESAITARKGDIVAGGGTTAREPDEAALVASTADAIARGAVVGWFQGRMEWGPRALGNRSILGDPRRADMKDILNAKIKRRESFRPFAPSILREAVGDWFETDADVPFMSEVFQVRAARRTSIPAVTHVDGSGRLQSVAREQNPRFHRLIATFGERTGVPIVLNTSFNENEPIVCTPREALDCFLRTRMDLLVLENWMVWRG